MTWEPSEHEVEEKLIQLAYLWGDIEEQMELGDDLAREIALAFRVEAQYDLNGWGDPCTYFVLFYDVTNAEARAAAKRIEESGKLRDLIREVGQPWHGQDFLIVRRVRPSAPVEGQICRRMLEEHPATPEPSLEDVPTPKPDSNVKLIQRDGYWLTPIEVPFYDALRETGLFFAVQPWIQGTDRRYRLDFLVFYDGGAVAVELDGHDWHKTREQRGYDAVRDRWFVARKITTLRFTGSQVHADAQGCVSELLNILRAAPARP